MAVNSVIARLGEAGETGAGASASAAAAAGAAPAATPATTGEVAPSREEPLMETRPGGASQPAQADGDSRALPSQIPAQAAPPQPPISPQARAMPHGQPAPQPSPAQEVGRARSSPLVRNIAREHGVNIDEISGTGLGGRVTKDDILSFIEKRKGAAPAPAPATAPAAPAPARPGPAAPFVPSPAASTGDRVTIEPMSKMRR